MSLDLDVKLFTNELYIHPNDQHWVSCCSTMSYFWASSHRVGYHRPTLQEVYKNTAHPVGCLQTTNKHTSNVCLSLFQAHLCREAKNKKILPKWLTHFRLPLHLWLPLCMQKDAGPCCFVLQRFKMTRKRSVIAA
jgi:hypothetical protein